MGKRRPRKPTTETPVVSFRFNPVMLQAIDEILRPDRGKLGPLHPPSEYPERQTRKDWVEHAMRYYLWSILRRAKGLNAKLLERICNDPDEVFHFFINFARAKRGVEGYGFSGDLPYGPPAAEYPEREREEANGGA